MKGKINCIFLVTKLAIEIGRKYQEGTHKNWVIHNYDAHAGTYIWALELSKSDVMEYI